MNIPVENTILYKFLYKNRKHNPIQISIQNEVFYEHSYRKLNPIQIPIDNAVSYEHIKNIIMPNLIFSMTRVYHQSFHTLLQHLVWYYKI